MNHLYFKKSIFFPAETNSEFDPNSQIVWVPPTMHVLANLVFTVVINNNNNNNSLSSTLDSFPFAFMNQDGEGVISLLENVNLSSMFLL